MFVRLNIIQVINELEFAGIGNSNTKSLVFRERFLLVIYPFAKEQHTCTFGLLFGCTWSWRTKHVDKTIQNSCLAT